MVFPNMWRDFPQHIKWRDSCQRRLNLEAFSVGHGVKFTSSGRRAKGRGESGGGGGGVEHRPAPRMIDGGLYNTYQETR